VFNVSEQMKKCGWCGADLSGKPYSRQTNVVTGEVVELCLKGCRWFPEAYPTKDWENWQEEVVHPNNKAERPVQAAFREDGKITVVPVEDDSPREKQGDLLLWAEEQRKLQQWTGGSNGP
jgi:hypothetical protein